MNCNLVKNDLVLVSNIKVASSFYMRMKGLMFSQSLDNRGGLLIVPCNSIHTFFMKYNLDVIFFSEDNQVVKITRNLRPWRITPIYFKSFKVLEIMGGTLDDRIKEGDELDFICTN